MKKLVYLSLAAALATAFEPSNGMEQSSSTTKSISATSEPAATNIQQRLERCSTIRQVLDISTPFFADSDQTTWQDALKQITAPDENTVTEKALAQYEKTLVSMMRKVAQFVPAEKRTELADEILKQTPKIIDMLNRAKAESSLAYLAHELNKSHSLRRLLNILNEQQKAKGTDVKTTEKTENSQNALSLEQKTEEKTTPTADIESTVSPELATSATTSQKPISDQSKAVLNKQLDDIEKTLTAASTEVEHQYSVLTTNVREVAKKEIEKAKELLKQVRLNPSEFANYNTDNGKRVEQLYQFSKYIYNLAYKNRCSSLVTYKMSNWSSVKAEEIKTLEAFGQEQKVQKRAEPSLQKLTQVTSQPSKAN